MQINDTIKNIFDQFTSIISHIGFYTASERYVSVKEKVSDILAKSFGYSKLGRKVVLVHCSETPYTARYVYIYSTWVQVRTGRGQESAKFVVRIV